MRYLCLTIVVLALSLAMYAEDVGWVQMSSHDAKSYDFTATIALVFYVFYMWHERRNR